MYLLAWLLFSDVGIQCLYYISRSDSLFSKEKRGSINSTPANPGWSWTRRGRVSQSATINQSELVVGVLCGSVSTNVNTGGGDAPIAIVRAHDVNSGANGNSACRDSLTSLSETGTRCRVDRDRTAVRRFGNDRIATHARHSKCLALALRPTCSRPAGHRLSVIGASLRESQRLGAVNTSLRDSR